MKTQRLHLLDNGFWQVGILPQTGMSTAFGRVRWRDAWLDFFRPTPEARHDVATSCSSYLLIPWSNRIKDATFRFRGRQYELRPTFADGSAIHGVAKDYAWRIERGDETSILASFDSRSYFRVNFPFAFSARAEVRLDGPRLVQTLWLKNEAHEPMPAGFGHHPYFVRRFQGDDDEVAVEVPCAKYFRLDHCIPREAPIPVEPHVDFRKFRHLGTVDDCLTDRLGDAPIRFHYPQSGLRIAMDCDRLFEHVIVHAPADSHHFAVEPLTHANDGFNLFERKIRGSGVFILEAGQEKSASFALRIEP